jgi:hypothetical protein
VSGTFTPDTASIAGSNYALRRIARTDSLDFAAGDTSGYGPLTYDILTAATNAATDTSGYGTSFAGNLGNVVANTLADTTGYGSSFGGNVATIVANTLADTTGYGTSFGGNVGSIMTNTGTDTTGYGASMGGNIASILANAATDTTGFGYMKARLLNTETNIAAQYKSLDSLLAIIDGRLATTHIEECVTLVNATSITADSIFTSSPWAGAGLYNQKTLFVYKGGTGDASDSVYVLGGYSPDNIVFTDVANLTFSVGTLREAVISLPPIYLPYVEIRCKNHFSSAVTWTIIACGKSSHGL